MRRVLVASHGYLANGIKSSMELLIGSKENVSYINAYVGEEDILCSIEAFMESVSCDDEAVVFTDLYGGSVNQKVIMNLPVDKKVFLITGFNLPVVLELLLYSEPLTEESVQTIVKASGVQLLSIKCENDSKVGEEESEDFFD